MTKQRLSEESKGEAEGSRKMEEEENITGCRVGVNLG